MEKEIISLIEENGPLTGLELRNAVSGDDLVLWRTCKQSETLAIQTVGTRYLRLDRRIEGFARLSPSIWRQFLTYSVVGLRGDPSPLKRKTQAVSSHIEEVSKAKLELACTIVSGLQSHLEGEWPWDHQVCYIVGGDIVHCMAHDVPRPERSTGKMVNGSDMDLVVVADDSVPESFMKRLDDAIFEEKYRFLITPHLREEIDYIVKKLERVREQVRFDTFKRMVACKILHEGTFLYGSEELFCMLKTMLREHGVIKRLNDLERRAGSFRKNAEEYLLHGQTEKLEAEDLYLFYPSEESEEFE